MLQWHLCLTTRPANSPVPWQPQSSSNTPPTLLVSKTVNSGTASMYLGGHNALLRVQVGGGLVYEVDVRRHPQGQRDGHPLQLPSRQVLHLRRRALCAERSGLEAEATRGGLCLWAVTSPLAENDQETLSDPSSQSQRDKKTLCGSPPDRCAPAQASAKCSRQEYLWL